MGTMKCQCNRGPGKMDFAVKSIDKKSVLEGIRIVRATSCMVSLWATINRSSQCVHSKKG